MSLNDFSIIQKLGQGSFAEVFKVRRVIDNNIYALKKIPINKLDEKSKQNALNEIRFLASFHCSNIIKYRQAFFDEQLKMLYVVMEYADKGDLGRLIEKKRKQKELFYQIEIWKIMISLINGLKYLHSRSILHRDLKPENIFLLENDIKIGDLNVSKFSERDIEIMQTQIGTPYFASPQIWQNKPYDKKCDIWSLGCVLYQIATLDLPFKSKSLDKLYTQITGYKRFRIPQHYSNQLEAIITKCLSIDPQKRPTVEELSKNFTVGIYMNLAAQVKCLDKDMEVQKGSLLKTIKGSLEMIQLPGSNYDQQKRELSKFRKSIENKYQKEKCQDLKIIEQVRNKQIASQLDEARTQKPISSQTHKQPKIDLGNQSSLKANSQFQRNIQIYRKSPNLIKRSESSVLLDFNFQERKIEQRKKSLPRTELSHQKLRNIPPGQNVPKQNQNILIQDRLAWKKITEYQVSDKKQNKLKKIDIRQILKEDRNFMNKRLELEQIYYFEKGQRNPQKLKRIKNIFEIEIKQGYR